MSWSPLRCPPLRCPPLRRSLLPLSLLPLWLLGCAARFSGQVQDASGAPVAGAMLDALGCDAVTDALGRFSVSCPPATYTFQVSHPDTLPAELRVDAPRGESSAPVLTLIRKPVDPGVFLYTGATAPGFAVLPPAPLTRTDSKSGTTARQRFCVTADAGYAPAPSGAQELWDNHTVDWKLFPLDADGCAWEALTVDGTWWEGKGDAIPAVSTATRSEGRFTLSYSLPAGRYVLAEWYAGFLVADGATYRAVGLEVP